MIDIQELKNQCSGRWFGILSSLGIEVRTDGRHEPCPNCGGKDRFRMEKSGDGFYCNQCSPGDTIALIQRVLGLTFHETIKRISELIGGVGMDKTQDTQIDKTDIKALLNKIWSESAPLSGSDPVSKYLHSRKLVLTPDNVRYCPECYESDTQRHYPAMIAKFVSKEGTPVCLHRCYLDRDTLGKANIESNKKFTPTIQPMPGGAVRLFSPDNEMFEKGVLGIGEGLESSMAAAQIHNIATWAAMSNTLLESFEPPENIKRIVIFGDSDISHVGQKSAYILANKLYNRDLIVEVRVPEIQGWDFADVLLDMSK